MLHTSETIPAEKIDLHRHVEGSVVIDALTYLAEKYGVPFTETTICRMNKNYESDDTRGSLEKFIDKLSTRWMKLLLAKIMVNTPDAALAKKVVAECVHDFYDLMVANASNIEGLKVMNILFSPRNLAVDGDLSVEKIQEYLQKKDAKKDLIDEEKKVYNDWIHHCDAKKGLSWTEYIKVVGESRKKLSKEYGMQLLITASFRRDMDSDFLRQSTYHLEKIGDELQYLFGKEYFDIVDICGLESLPQYKLWKYMRFYRQMDKRIIPISGHVAELNDKEYLMANQNLTAAVRDKPTWEYNYPFRILAHAVGIAGKNVTTQRIRDDFAKKSEIRGTIIALNASSNEATTVVNSALTHPLALQSFELFLKNQRPVNGNGHRKPLSLNTVVTSDDPNAFSKIPVMSLQNEFDLHERAFQQFTASVPKFRGAQFSEYKAYLDQHTQELTERLISTIRSMRIQSNYQTREKMIQMSRITLTQRAVV
ncbi:MAG: hypothetical protein ABI425_03760 [Patescibacteria group bacterium]